MSRCIRVYPFVERNHGGIPFSGVCPKINDKTIIIVIICPSDRFCRVQNLPTSSVELFWPITELYFRQILSTDFMNRFYQDVKTGPFNVYFRKINIGGVHLIEGFPNATRQRPEHSRVTTAARRQTAPPHNTHNFCWHGLRQRSHGEGNR